MATPAHLYATTGHAAATLARRASLDTVRADATRRLTRAVDEFDRHTHARAAALCMAQLATLHLETGELHEGGYWGRMALEAASIRSARLVEHLHSVRHAATAHHNEPPIKQLVADIDEAIASGDQ